MDRSNRRIVCLGEAMIEMTSAQHVDTWRMGYAGDTLNTAWYMRAFLDASWNVSYYTALGTDRYSEALASFITEAGIDTRLVTRIPDRNPGIYFIHQEHGDRQFTYWRERSAAKLLARDPSALSERLAQADIIYFSGITVAIVDEDREALLSAISRRRREGAKVCFDPNIRPRLWEGQDSTRHWLTEAAKVADLVMPTFEDEAQLFGDTDPQSTSARYAALGATEIIVKDGARPALIAHASQTTQVSALPVDNVLDATGAGDSFNGGYLAARLAGADIEAAASFAHRVAGACLAHQGALMPRASLQEIASY